MLTFSAPKKIITSPMFCPKCVQWQNVALLFQKCVNISSGYFLMLYPKVSQVRCYNVIINLTPPPYISECRHFFVVFRMSLRHLYGWLSIKKKIRTEPNLGGYGPWLHCAYTDIVLYGLSYIFVEAMLPLPKMTWVEIIKQCIMLLLLLL